MTASVKILTTATNDCSPSILLISPNGHKTLINCGEGCQRSFLESSDRIRSVKQVLLTHIGYEATGGMPGMILTSADSAQASVTAKKSKSDANSNGSSNGNGDKGVVGSLTLIGPRGLKGFVHSLRHFMRRDRFPLTVHEGEYHVEANPGDGLNSTGVKGGKKRKKAGGDVGRNGKDSMDANVKEVSANRGIYGITSMPMKRQIRTFYGMEETYVSSYIFTTAPIAGKFQIEKARALKIPPGPLYSKLKSGETVSFQLKSGDDVTDVTVTPDQVLEAGSDGVAAALIYCPDEYVLDQFCGSNESTSGGNISSNGGDHDNSNGNGDVRTSVDKLNRFKQNGAHPKDGVELELMVHYTPKHIFESKKYRSWMKEFGTHVQHIALPPVERDAFIGGNEELDGSPYRSAMKGAMQRSLIHGDIYPSPIPFDSSSSPTSTAMDCEGEGNVGNESEDGLNIITARPGLEYILIPIAKKGVGSTDGNQNNQNGENHQGGSSMSNADYQSVRLETERSGALEEASIIMKAANVEDSELTSTMMSTTMSESSNGDGVSSPPSTSSGSFIFTGTGSAIPCKHRNVTGMYVEMKDGKGMLLDIGEGTLGQLIRSWKSTYRSDGDDDASVAEYIQKCITNIKFVWISHPHADHHLGILRFLTQRNAILLKARPSGIGNDDRVVVMTSKQILHFLDEYSRIDPTIYEGYIAVDNRDALPDLPENTELNTMLNAKLGITSILTVPVSHCYQSFAAVIDGTSFGRLVYSGDCRPSDYLVRVGQGADLLVHEATFEDGMEEEAVLKMHATVSEALSVAKRMGAKACVLTHFSQRYPRIAPLCEEDAQLPFPVAFAFDFMKITPDNIALASNLTSSLRMLYPDDEMEDEKEEMDETKRKAQALLSTPGLFANIQCKN